MSTSRGGLSYDLGILPDCGEQGIRALAAAIGRLGDSALTYLRDLVVTAAETRDDRVFDAALQVAGAAGASARGREAALVILGRQLRPGFHFGVANDGRCLFGGSTDVWGRGDISADRPGLLLALLDTLIRDRTLDPPMRMFVRCVAWQVEYYNLPLDVRPDDLHVELVCGYRIRVRNDAPDDAVIEIREDLTGEISKVTVPAGREAEFATSLPEGSTIYAGGPVYVTLQGEDVWRGVTTGWPWWCPPE